MRQDKVLYYLAPAVFGAMLALFYGVHDYWLDDYEFSRFLNIGTGSENLLSLVAERWRTDSFRLCNFSVPPLLLLPRWFTALLMGAGWSAFLLLSLRLFRLSDWRSAWFAVGLLSVFPAWWSYLPTLSSNVNYIPSLLIGVVLLRIFINGNRLPCFVCLIAGFFAGWWHEGLSGPLIVSFLSVMILHKDLRTGSNMSLTAGLIAGFLVLNLNPGLIYRMNMANEYGELYSTGAVRMVNLMINCSLPLIVVLMAWICVPRLRRRALWQMVVIMMAASLALEAVTGIVRASFMSQYISCIAVVWVAAKAFRSRAVLTKNLLAVISGLTCVATFSCAVYGGIKVNGFNRAFIEASVTNPGSTKFVFAIMPGEAPTLALGKSPSMIYQLPAFNYVCPVEFDDILDTKVIPDEFADFMPGFNGWQQTESGNWRRGRALVMPYAGESTDIWRRLGAEVSYPVLGRIVTVVNALPFRGCDGNIYRAIVLNEQPPFMPEPADIRITREHGVFSFR
ncbi:MAG: hypothetical protein K2M19_04860 [Muribaculaceae bacterium]|nr:hypothetical protein [Muribaculaceae bacterium]